MATRLVLEEDCQEPWEGMAPCAGGRFCNACAKPVLDLTTWSRADILRQLEQHPGTCGQYRPEQLEPTLVPLDAVTVKTRRNVLAALTALALHGTVRSQPPAAPTPTEQLPTTAATDKKVEQPPVGGMLGHFTSVEATPTPKPHAPRARWYVDHRFPFLHKRGIRRGRVRIGPPF